jgi:anti-sigma factor RsiW
MTGKVMSSLPNITIDHRSQWADRLEEFIDDALTDGEREAVEKHVTGCEICSADIEALRALDATLAARIVAPALDAEFDRKVRARVASYDETARQRARQQAELERARDESSLASAWRRRRQRMLLDAIAIAGCLCALGCVLSASGVWSSFETKLAHVTGMTTQLLNFGTLAILVTVISAGVGVVLRSRDE